MKCLCVCLCVWLSLLWGPRPQNWANGPKTGQKAPKLGRRPLNWAEGPFAGSLAPTHTEIMLAVLIKFLLLREGITPLAGVRIHVPKAQIHLDVEAGDTD